MVDKSYNVSGSPKPFPAIASSDGNYIPLVALASVDSEGNINSKTSATTENGAVAVGNAIAKFRDGFQQGLDTSVWDVVWQNQGTGFAARGGNCAGSAYLRVNLDPTVADSELTLTSKQTFRLPSRFAYGFSHSQRVIGQEFEYSLVGCNAAGVIEIINPVSDLTINGTVSVTSNVATINFSTAHGLVGDDRVILVGNADSRINVGPVYVTVITSTQITVPLTIANGTYTAGGVVRVANIDEDAFNSVGFTLENTTATNARWFTRRAGASSRHVNATIGTTVATQSNTSPFSDAFNATSEHEVATGLDQAIFNSKATNALTAPSGNLRWSEGIPDETKLYKLRIRSKNLANLARPVAKITAIAKTGTTTATVTTEAAHGLSTNSWVQISGVRDQANFPNLTSATQVASIVSSTQFTIVIGSASTTSSAGGSVILNEGGILASALGFQALAVQSIARTNNIVTITVNTTATGALPGDMFRLHGCDATAMGLYDGAYRILRMTGSTYEVDSPGPNVVSVNCGGNLFKSTCNRLHYVREMEYTRLVAELSNQNGILDAAKSLAVAVTNTPATTISSGTITTVTNVTNAGTPTAPTNYFLNSAASTNGALIITGTTGVQAIHATNNLTTPAYLKLYNKATAPTVGTDVPEMTILIPAAAGTVLGQVSIPMGFSGYRFPLGLGIAITGAFAVADTTAVGAGQVAVKISRTA